MLDFYQVLGYHCPLRYIFFCKGCLPFKIFLPQSLKKQFCIENDWCENPRRSNTEAILCSTPLLVPGDDLSSCFTPDTVSTSSFRFHTNPSIFKFSRADWSSFGMDQWNTSAFDDQSLKFIDILVKMSVASLYSLTASWIESTPVITLST